MLLRSSSTPLLGSLISSKDLEPEVKNGGHPTPCRSSSVTSNLQSSSIVCLSAAGRDCNSAQENLKRELDKGIARPPRVRKVKSVNDLQTLSGKRAFPSPAEVAAETFSTSVENGRIHEIVVHSEPPFPRQKRQFLHNTSLRRFSSLPSNGASEVEMKCSLSPDDLLPKFDELSCSSPCSSTHDEGYASKFSNLERHIIAGSEKMVTQPTSVNINGRGSSAACECLGDKMSELACSFRSEWHGSNLLTKSDVESFLRNRGSGEASFSGRKAQSYFLSKAIYSEESNQPAVTHECRTSPEPGKLGFSTGLSGSGFGNGNGSRNGDRGGGSNGDYSDSDQYYQTMLKVDPCNPLLLRNYACFLFEVRKDFRRAEEYFERAILAMPGEGEILARYANLIWQVNRDADRAANYFDQAVQASPSDPFVLAANASFIWASECDEKLDEPFSSTFSPYREATPVSG